MTDLDDEYERADRLADLRETLSKSLRAAGVSAWAWEIEDDILVSGALSTIIEWAQDWRSEIEELG